MSLKKEIEEIDFINSKLKYNPDHILTYQEIESKILQGLNKGYTSFQGKKEKMHYRIKDEILQNILEEFKGIR